MIIFVFLNTESAMGVSINAQRDTNSEYVKAVNM